MSNLDNLNQELGQLDQKRSEVIAKIDAINDFKELVGERIFASICYMEIFIPIKPLEEWTVEDTNHPELKKYMKMMDTLYSRFSHIFPQNTSYLSVLSAYKISINDYGANPQY